MTLIPPLVPPEERGTYGLRLAHAERDTLEVFASRNDVGLHAGDHDTGCVLGFMQMDHNTRS